MANMREEAIWGVVDQGAIQAGIQLNEDTMTPKEKLEQEELMRCTWEEEV